MPNTFQEDLQKIIESLRVSVEDAAKMDGGNVSAGKRLRKQAQEAVHLLKSLRQGVQERRNGITEKRRSSREVENISTTGI